MELFELAVKENKLHPLFKRIISEKSYRPTIEVINKWSKGMTGRTKESKKFVQDFQISFSSSLWELYLNKVFVGLGFYIDYSKESPDFHLFPFLKEKYSLLVSSSESEQKNLYGAFNMSVEQVVITGLPRNDIFTKDQPKNSQFKILYAPTFRGTPASDNTHEINLFNDFGFDYKKKSFSLLKKE